MLFERYYIFQGCRFQSFNSQSCLLCEKEGAASFPLQIEASFYTTRSEGVPEGMEIDRTDTVLDKNLFQMVFKRTGLDKFIAAPGEEKYIF